MSEYFEENPNFSLLLFIDSVLVLFSFLYEYFMEYNNLIITIIIMVIDIALLFYNIYYIKFNETKNVKQSLLYMFILSIVYLFLGSLIILLVFNINSNFVNYYTILKNLIFLGPLVIIVGPIIYLIGGVAS